jgi:hypothetical protein
MPGMELKRLVPLLVTIAVLATACGGVAQGASTPSQDGAGTAEVSASRVPAAMDQVNDGGGVIVKATWAGLGDGLRFTVALNTHSVDLDGLDLRSATLRNDRGETLVDPAWEAPKGGHHRSGALSFDGDAGAFLAGAAWIELFIPDVAGVPTRALRWRVEP